MGIAGLLPFLKGIQRNVHVSSFQGKKVAVDAYCWLHKGAYSCAAQLVMKTEKVENLPFIRYCMRRVHLLRKYDITPILVFDGGYLPTKANVEHERREKRDSYRQKGKALLKDGKRSEAYECFQKCVDVSPEMALAFIKECRSIGVECIVAPYEADAQLTYLQKEGIVDYIISEDSDMLVFGCTRVLFKMDESGNGKLIELQDLGKANKSLIGFTQESFRQMCILSGCDYLSSIPGVGLGRASKLMKRFNCNPYKVIKSLQYETGKVPKDYEENFRKAEYTFLYQLVFDTRTQTQVRLNELPDDVDPRDFEYAGVESSPRKAIGMARGNINPFTHEVMDTYSPSKAPPPKSTSWAASAMGGANRQYPLAIQAKLTSSAGTKKQFKPPKRSAPVEDASLNDEQLQSIYSTSEGVEDESTGSLMSQTVRELDTPSGQRESLALDRIASISSSSSVVSQSQQSVVTLSRFFTSKLPDSESEFTPSEDEAPKEGSVSRTLRLGPSDEEDYPRRRPEVGALGMLESSLGSATASPLCDSVPESPLESTSQSSSAVSRVLGRPPEGRSLARKRLFERFSYSKTPKKSRLHQADPVSVFDKPESPATDSSDLYQPTRREQFSVSGVGPPAEETSEPDSAQSQPSGPLVKVQQQSQCSEMDVDSDVGDCSQSPSADAADAGPSKSNRHIMSSEDFITSAAFGASSSSVESMLDGDSQRTENDSVDIVDLTSNTVSRLEPLARSQPERLFSNPPLSKASGKHKGEPKVGLRRSTPVSRFKAPRPSDSGLKQTSMSSFLASFSYQKKPQMSLQ